MSPKNTTLTLVGCTSSFLGYLLYAGTGIASWVYLDSFTNCVVIGLMFQVNSWWYQNLCGLCIRCCFSKSKGDKERVLDMSQVDSASRTSPLSTSPSAQQFSATPSVLAPQSTMRSITVATAVSPTVEPPSAAEADFEIVEKE